MMFVRTIIGLVLMTVATSTQVPLVDQLFKLEPTAHAGLPSLTQHKEDAVISSSTDYTKFSPKGFPQLTDQNQAPAVNAKDFPLMNVQKETKTFVFPPLMVKKTEKAKSDLIPAVKNTKSAASNHNLPLFSDPRAAPATIPAAFLQKKPEPKLAPSGIPLAFLEKKPAANFEKVSLATPKSLRTRAEQDQKANELPFVQFNLRKRSAE